MSLVVAGLQHAGVLGDVAANLAILDDAAARARAAGADVLVTPEMFTTGYALGDALPDLVGHDPAAVVAPLARIARERGVALVVGAPDVVLDAAGRRAGIANAVHVLDDAGELLTTYRKTHLFGALDRSMFVPGGALSAVVTLRGVRLAVMVCYDVEFPETVRAAALAGADAVLVPTAQMEPFAHVAERLIRVRAWENQVYVAYVNRVGTEPGLRYVGRSSVVAPSGEVLDHLDGDGSGLVTATIDPAVVRSARRDNPYLDDLRPSLYPSAVPGGAATG